MLKVHLWDEIGGKWSRWELDLPHVCRDSQAISNEVTRASGERVDQNEPHWRVTDSTRCGPLLVTVAHDDRDHLLILLVNDHEQDSEYRCPECGSEQAARGYYFSGLPGVIAHVENGTFEKAERCDTCMRFATDDEAAAALQNSLALPAEADNE